MTRKHATPEYRRNAAILRARVSALHRAGEPTVCWRGGGLILPGQAWDVGHVTGATGSTLSDLAPEHRHAQARCCDGNRREGGRVGALLTNRARVAVIPNDQSVKAWRL